MAWRGTLRPQGFRIEGEMYNRHVKARKSDTVKQEAKQNTSQAAADGNLVERNEEMELVAMARSFTIRLCRPW